jgi:exodeoxyribonuclease V alpha subunit
MSDASITVTVSTVLHKGRFGGAVFAGYDGEGKRVKAVADGQRMPNAPLRGETWQLTGVFREHRVYGVQFYVAGARLIRPHGKLLVRFLSTHPAFRGAGVGPAKAARLYEMFGDGLKALLDGGDDGTLRQVLSEETAGKLVAAWQGYSKELDVIAFLERHGVDVRLSNKILRYWPENTVEKLQENPYRLLVTLNWNPVDRLALSLGVGAKDGRRLVAAAEAAVYSRLDDAKDTLVSDACLRESLRGILRCYDDETIWESIEHALSDRAIVGNAEVGYRAFGCALMENYLLDRFEAMSGRRNHQQSLFTSEDRIAYCVREFERESGIRLNAEQKAAVVMAVREPVSVITGGAGVGKTTVLKAVHHAVEASGGSVIQMALAGRAAHRMREATGREAYTIIGFLNAVHLGKIKLTSRHLIVIDEASMLDLMLAYRLVRVLPKGARLLLTGDAHQLPPIGPGLVFHVLAKSAAISVQELIQVHRQAESTGIPLVAHQVRNGVVPELPPFEGPRPGVSFLECSVGSITDHLVEIVSALGGFDEVQILGITKNGPAGTTNINEMFHRMLSRGKARLHEWGIAESDPVIYTVNDYDRELYNGSLGRVEKVLDEAHGSAEERHSVVCNFDGRKIDLTVEELGNLDLAYAITTHKAQGSQFQRVIMPVIRSRLLDRSLIYTGLTRGVEQVVLIGDREAFNRVVKEPPTSHNRKVGFSL